MTVFILGALALLLGYLFYTRVLQGMFRPFRSPTPAYSHNDGVDFVPMPTWKNHMIKLLNIAVPRRDGAGSPSPDGFW